MNSPARVEANRRNALRSTGPRTAEGMATSSRNATRHGLLSRQRMLAHEDPLEYDQLRDSLVDALSPDGAVEELLVDDIVRLLWRLRRVANVETALYSIGLQQPVLVALTQAGEADAGVGAAFASQAHAFATLSRYEVSLANRLRRALADLQKVQSDRDMTDTKLVVIAGER